LAILTFPGGIAQLLFDARDRIVQRVTGTSADERGAVVQPAAPALNAPSDASDGELAPATIEAIDVVVRFGGITAVDGATVRAGAGQIVGIVGPNGAGKTTLFDVLSGQRRPNAGRVLLDGEDITALRPERRARIGVGRTFQQARLFDGLRVTDVFKVALECEEPSEVVPSILGLPPSRQAEHRKDLGADEIVSLLGLGDYGNRFVSELSTGVRRMVELGCMIGLGARTLLLDEPTAGIAQREVEAFRPLLEDIRRHLGATVVLIEHDLPLIMGLADHLYVLAEGKVIAEGDPRALRDDPTVIAAYLGTDERVIERSGTRTPARSGA
jgi:ABC-type branched-subunit amino acid transport system ATPase component